MKTVYGLALALALGLATALAWPTDASGTASGPADITDWALPDGTLALVFRGVDTVPARLDALAKRFAGAKRLMRDIEAVRAIDIRGMRPGGTLLDGMDPARGLAVFATDTGRLRVVVGATDGARLRRSIAAFAGSFDMPLQVTDDGFAGPMPLKCADAGGLMICDTVEVPAAPPGRPADLPTDTWLTIRVSGPAMAALPPPWNAMVGSARFDVRADDARVVGQASVSIKPEMLPMYAQVRDVLRPTTGASATEAVHPRTPFLFKLSLDAEKLAAAGAGAMPPALAGKVKALARHWSGELALSFVGSFAEPVLALGLGEGSKSDDLIDAALALLPPDVERPEKTADALIVRTAPDPELADAPLVITVSYRTVGGHLLLGLDPVDLQRVADERGPPPTMPPALAARGAHGSFLAHAPISPANGTGEFMKLDLPPGKQWPALLNWLQAEAYLMDGIWSIVTPGEDAMTIEMGWSRL